MLLVAGALLTNVTNAVRLGGTHPDLGEMGLNWCKDEITPADFWVYKQNWGKFVIQPPARTPSSIFLHPKPLLHPQSSEEANFVHVTGLTCLLLRILCDSFTSFQSSSVYWSVLCP